MDIQDFWQKKLQKYSSEEWSEKPSIFVQEVEKYFPKNGKVLELGAGLGQDVRYLANKGFQVMSTDVSEFGLGFAKEKAKDLSNIEFKQVDMGKPLEFEKESFEVIYSHLGIHYFDKKRTTELFKEMKDILKPGGILAIIVNSTDDPEIKDYKELEKDYYEDDKGLWKRFFNIDTLKGLAEGFEILILDNSGTAFKDNVKNVSGLIRFVGRNI